MSNRLPYNFDSSPSHPSAAAATAESHAFPANEANSNHCHRSNPSSSSSSHHHNITVAEWAGTQLGTSQCKSSASQTLLQQEVTPNDWRDVHRNIKRMDQLYDATFYSWLKSDDNVFVTAMYLHRIANEYGLGRIVNALKWLVADWRWESTSILVRHVTADWCNVQGDFDRAHLLRHLTAHWATHYTAALITTILATPPYSTSDNQQRERFLRALTKDWDFSKLSEFFMYLQSRANVDHKLKCVMLQEAARRERETLSAKLNNRKKQQPRAASTIAVADAAAAAAATTANATVDKSLNTNNEESNPETERNRGKARASQVITTCQTDDVDYQDADGCGDERDNRTKYTSSSSSSSCCSGSQEEGSSSTSSWRHHHRRISNNVAADMNKRFRTSRSELAEPSSPLSSPGGTPTPSPSVSSAASSSAAMTMCSTTTTNSTGGAATAMSTVASASSGPSPVPSSSITPSNRRAATPDHAGYHLHHLRTANPDVADVEDTCFISQAAASAAAASASSSSNAASSAPSANSGARRGLHHHNFYGRRRRSSSSSSTTSTSSAEENDGSGNGIKKRQQHMNSSNQDTSLYG